MSEYKNRKQREAEAELTAAQAENARVATAAAKAELGGTQAAAETRQAGERLKQLRIQQQLDEQKALGDDRAARRRKEKAQAAADEGLAFKRMTLVAVIVLLGVALPAQISYFLGLHKPGQESAGPAWLMAPAPFGLEMLAWVGVAGTSWARRKGLPLWPFWLITGGLASFAAAVNLSHGAADFGPVAGFTLGGFSLAAPLLWELREWMDARAAVDGRDRQQRAADKKAAKEKAAKAARQTAHEAERAKLFPQVHERFQQIMAAHPLGAIDREKAWGAAWTDIHRAPLGVTAATYRGRVQAEERLEQVLDPDGDASVYKALDAFLWDTLGGDDEEGGGTLLETAPKGPQPGPSQARKSLGGKGQAPSRPARQSAPETRLDPEHVKAVRELAELFASANRTISTADVKKLIGGGRTEYLVRLRKAATEPEPDAS
ncbi:hypothetical protein [Kitasatospora indigofera]|uniref:hypothetical protein n=1 Tax=Kitasatospora indigofera TaxID=67307 RepID=UPI0036850CF4